MSIIIRITASESEDQESKPDEGTMELCGHALSSNNPPLSETSISSISAIEEARTANLEGGDLLHATQFFEHLRALPPIKGPETANFLNLLAISNFSLEEMGKGLNYGTLMKDSAEATEPPQINRGFRTVSAREITCGEDTEIAFDVNRADREGKDCLARMFIALLSIEDPEVKLGLVEDCKKIVELRFHFDLSD